MIKEMNIESTKEKKKKVDRFIYKCIQKRKKIFIFYRFGFGTVFIFKGGAVGLCG